MDRTVRFAAVLLPIFLLIACGNQGDDASHQVAPENILIAEQPAVHGWMELVLPDGAPGLLCTDDESAWLLLEGSVLMQFREMTGTWRCFDLDDAGTVRDMVTNDGKVYLLSDPSLLIFDGDNLARVPLPEGIVPRYLGVSESVALLAENGTIAVLSPEMEFELTAPSEPLEVSSDLFRTGGDWAYLSSDGILNLVDTEIGLWRSEEVPFGEEILLAADGSSLFIGTEGSVYRRTAPEQWEEICSGKLYSSGLVLRDEGVAFASSLEHMIAGRPAIDPLVLQSLGMGEPIWAMDESGVLAWSELGTVETRLPMYEMERIECNLAGQNGGTGYGSGEDISPVNIAVSGVFRIYESVSSRPDPFTEFPPTRRDLRRSLEDLAIEELHLVGITIDPFGGDQAMVEDANGVPYILYENTVLANNTHIAEITSNEVIVVQEVAVGIGEDGVEPTSIPTIYSMRLHEEGGL